MRIFFLLFILSAILPFSPVHAQLFSRKAKKGAVPPKALLVTILTRQNQRQHLKTYRPDLLPEFDRDVREVAKRTVKDFSTYFRFCPVYFFIDTMGDKIALGEFEGVLLDSSLHPVSNSVLSPGDRNFYIAHYGNPIPQPDSVRAGTTDDMGGSVETYGDDPTALFREKLLVSDGQFRLLSESGPRTNYIRAMRPNYMSMGEYRIYRRAITYNANRWYVDYLPCAYSYDATLRRYFRTK